MTPRLESAEVRGFQLVVPRADLERLPEVAAEGGGLQLAVSLQGGRLSVTVVDGMPLLQFRVARDGRATLEQVELRGDDCGPFLLQVLGPLVVRHGGNLHVLLAWSEPGPPAELRVQGGKTDFPGLSAAEEPPDRPLTAEEREVQALLERAAAEWARYQQLKQKGR